MTEPLRATAYDPASGTFLQGGEDLIERWRGEPALVLWLELFAYPVEEERRLLHDVFGIHPLAIQDAQRDRHPPKLERFDDYDFILLRGMEAADPVLESPTVQIALFLGERFLITRHAKPSPSVERVFDDERTGTTSRLARGTGYVLAAISRTMTDRYLKMLMQVEASLDELEDEVFAHPDDRQLEELIGYRTGLERHRRTFDYHERLFREASERPAGFVDDELRHLLIDVYEQADREKSLAEMYYGLASDLMDGYISLASHRLNHIVKILTIVTTIFVPLGFLAGIYGMNFEHMPELKFRYGYFVLLGAMFSLVAGLLFVFRRKRWL